MSRKRLILNIASAALAGLLILPASGSAQEPRGCGCDDRDCIRSESCEPDWRYDERRRDDDRGYEYDRGDPIDRRYDDDRRYGYDRGYPADRRYDDRRRYEDRRPAVTERPSFGSHAIRGWEPSNRVAPTPQDKPPLYRDSYRGGYR